MSVTTKKNVNRIYTAKPNHFYATSKLRFHKRNRDKFATCYLRKLLRHIKTWGLDVFDVTTVLAFFFNSDYYGSLRWKYISIESLDMTTCSESRQQHYLSA